MENNTDSENYLDEYRNYLVSSKYKLEETIDKYLISLSTGSIAVSLLFVSNIIKNKPIQSQLLLFLSWLFFSATILIVVMSYLSAVTSFSKAIKQTDSDKIYSESPGGIWNKITKTFNYVSIVTFFIGLILLLLFSSKNLTNGVVMTDKKDTSKQTTKEKAPTVVPPKPIEPKPTKDNDSRKK